MESLYWSAAVHKDFNWSVVEFADGLQLHIIPPTPIHTLASDVVIEISFNIVLEEVLLVLDVVQTQRTDFKVEVFTAVELVGNGPEETVTVSTHFLDDKVAVAQGRPQFSISLFEFGENEFIKLDNELTAALSNAVCLAVLTDFGNALPISELHPEIILRVVLIEMNFHALPLSFNHARFQPSTKLMLDIQSIVQMNLLADLPLHEHPV